jgi:tetratricopeptide (TPR) repeat protein
MNPRAPEELLRIARQLELERSEAKPIVNELRHTIDDQWEREIPSDWRRLGLVLELVREASDALESAPRRSLSFAQFAIVIVTTIPATAYPPPLLVAAEAKAWKELANAHRYLGEYEAALRAVDAADRHLDASNVLGHDRAVMQFARALVLADIRRFDEAQVLLAKSAAVFAEFNDTRRAGQTLLLQGMIEQRQDHLPEACEAYTRAIKTLKNTDDVMSLASAYNNLGHAYIDRGERQAAVTALQSALSIFTELGKTGEMLRTRFLLGRVLLRAGHHATARDLLIDVRRMFLGLDMTEEAGIAGLELVEALLALGEQGLAQGIVEDVLREFQHAGVSERAATALAYLLKIVATERGREAVRHVQTYVEALQREPMLLFAPLPEP